MAGSIRTLMMAGGGTHAGAGFRGFSPVVLFRVVDGWLIIVGPQKVMMR